MLKLTEVSVRAARLPVAYLSAGQRHRVALARLLVAHRPLWLLDEPTAGMNPGETAQMTALIKRLRDERVAQVERDLVRVEPLQRGVGRHRFQAAAVPAAAALAVEIDGDVTELAGRAADRRAGRVRAGRRPARGR